MRVIHLMQENVTTVTSLHDLIGRGRIAGEHNFAIASLERIPESFFPYSMLDGKCCDRYVFVAIYNARPNFMNVHFEAGGVGLLEALPTDSDIVRPSFLNMRGHVFQAVRPIGFERIFSSQHP